MQPTLAVDHSLAACYKKKSVLGKFTSAPLMDAILKQEDSTLEAQFIKDNKNWVVKGCGENRSTQVTKENLVW